MGGTMRETDSILSLFFSPLKPEPFLPSCVFVFFYPSFMDILV